MKIKLKPIKEQVVVVFGASSGIGRETALKFGKAGAKVAVSARSEDGLESLVQEIRRAGGEAVSLPAEVSDFSQVKSVADLTVEQYGRLDTWVHAAAVAVYAPFDQTTPEEFKRVLDVNANGQAYGAMAALPYLRQAGGALIHVSSVESMRPLPFHSAYSASKHAIHGFVQTMRMELRHDKVPVSVTEIMPASINTPFFNKNRTKIGVKPVGMPPLYEPSVVADAILYAAQHPVREIITGGAGKMMILSERTSPRLTDKVMEMVGFAGQKTKEPKSADAPTNLYEPIAGYDRAEGDFGKLSKSRSVDTWFGTHPNARRALLGAGLVGAGLLWNRRRQGKPGSGGTAAPKVEEVIVEEILIVDTARDGDFGRNGGNGSHDGVSVGAAPGYAAAGTVSASAA